MMSLGSVPFFDVIGDVHVKSALIVINGDEGSSSVGRDHTHRRLRVVPGPLTRSDVFIPSGTMEPTLHVGDRILVTTQRSIWTINARDISCSSPATEHWTDGSYTDLVKR